MGAASPAPAPATQRPDPAVAAAPPTPQADGKEHGKVVPTPLDEVLRDARCATDDLWVLHDRIWRENDPTPVAFQKRLHRGTMFVAPWPPTLAWTPALAGAAA